MFQRMEIHDWLGTIGVGLLLLAYVLDLLDWLRDDSLSYLLLNLVGATMACSAAAMIGFMPFVILEGTWALVSGVALLRRWWVVSARG
jgi:hypothetical protein